jgi:murein DD-endopeptidase MepM/ murein hydrolase activator NlpD
MKKNHLLNITSASLLFTLVACNSVDNNKPKPTKEKANISKAKQKQTSPKKKKIKVIKYRVHKGETLSSIARKFYNGEAKWTKIYELNKALIKNPNNLTVGQLLFIPLYVDVSKKVKSSKIVEETKAQVVTIPQKKVLKPTPPKPLPTIKNDVKPVDKDKKILNKQKNIKQEAVSTKKDKVKKEKVETPENVKVITKDIPKGNVVKLNLDKKQLYKIGLKIFKNECSGKRELLTVWNKGEEFPSFGIGHFIWYPENCKAQFTETFPELIRFAQDANAILPPVLVPSDKFVAPWKSREEFYSKINLKEMENIRHFLYTHIALQVKFMVNRTELSLSKISADLNEPKLNTEIKNKFYRLLSFPRGVFALIDYINFKGEGVNHKERYNDQGWGLLQVLQQMNSNKLSLSNDEVMKEFIRSAKFILELRVINSPKDRNEKRWIKGWNNRIDSYIKPI